MDTEMASSSSDGTDCAKQCRICKKSAHGVHYGAETCRACAAFFRRTASNRNSLNCRFPDKKCNDKHVNGNHRCKKCRLELCFEEGMTLDNFQYQRDPFSMADRPDRSLISKESVSEDEIPMSLEKFVGRPHMLIQCEPDLASTTKIYIDMTFLVQKMSNVFLEVPVNIKSRQTCLESLTMELKELRRGTTGKMKVYRKIGKLENFIMWEYELVRSSKWFSKFDAFREMELADKMRFISKTWYVWGIFEKLALTAQKRDSQECDEHSVMINDNAKFDITNTELDVSWCTKYGTHQLVYFLGGQDSWVGAEIIRILRKLQPTDVEQNYIIAQTCLNYAAKHRSHVNLKAIEQMQETLSHDIHVYYSEQLKLPYYAARLAQLLKCDRLIQNYLYERRRKAELAKLFDVYFIRVSHPEMFEETGY